MVGFETIRARRFLGELYLDVRENSAAFGGMPAATMMIMNCLISILGR